MNLVIIKLAVSDSTEESKTTETQKITTVRKHDHTITIIISAVGIFTVVIIAIIAFYLAQRREHIKKLRLAAEIEKENREEKRRQRAAKKRKKKRKLLKKIHRREQKKRKVDAREEMETALAKYLSAQSAIYQSKPTEAVTPSQSETQLRIPPLVPEIISSEVNVTLRSSSEIFHKPKEDGEGSATDSSISRKKPDARSFVPPLSNSGTPELSIAQSQTALNDTKAVRSDVRLTPTSHRFAHLQPRASIERINIPLILSGESTQPTLLDNSRENAQQMHLTPSGEYIQQDCAMKPLSSTEKDENEGTLITGGPVKL